MKVASRASPRRQVAKELPWWRWWRTALRDAQTLENSPRIATLTGLHGHTPAEMEPPPHAMMSKTAFEVAD